MATMAAGQMAAGALSGSGGGGGLGGLSGGISGGAGGISPSSSASSSNKGGNNSLGGFSFGNYNASPNYTPYIIGAVALAVLFYLMKGKKRR